MTREIQSERGRRETGKDVRRKRRTRPRRGGFLKVIEVGGVRLFHIRRQTLVGNNDEMSWIGRQWRDRDCCRRTRESGRVDSR